MPVLALVNPRKKRRSSRRKARRNPAAAPNPRRRRRARRARRNQVAANPRRRRYGRRSRRNPRAFSIAGAQRVIVPAAIGGVGAVALNAVFNMLPFPAQFKTGLAGTATKLAAAIFIPMLAGQFIGRENARIITLVTAGGIFATEAAKLGQQAGVPGMAEFIPMSEYIPTIGWPNAAAGVDGPLVHSYTLPSTPQNNMGAYSPSDGLTESDYM